MSFLLDSSVVIDAIRGRDPSASLIDSWAESPLYISVISFGELLDGLASPARRSSPQRHRFEEFVTAINLLRLGEAEARMFAMLRSDLLTAGLLIPDNDLWIAATAIEHRLTLVSSDQHFERVPCLELYVP